MDDLIVEFLTETSESLNELDNDLVIFEQNPENGELLSKIFRVMHTIKGTCGFLALPRMEKIAHAAEDLLGLFRDGKIKADQRSVSLILQALDAIKRIIAAMGQGGREPAGDDSVLIAQLHAACSCDAQPPATLEDNVEPAPVQKPEHEAASGEFSLAAQSLRVSVETLENLMTMVSELVLTRNQILQIARNQKDSLLSPSLQRLNHIVSDLQEGVMKTRMQPVGNAWSKLPRIVRDISSELGKKIELEMYGQDTELDRQVLEMIKDPLTHMVRNSCDHGIEMPEDRIMAGKPETGRIKLNSWHEGGYIIIEISDDGKGLPLERIKRKILENHLATDAEIAAMSPQEIQQFIFHAGFSTADQITAVSGRGVGMDVVRSNIQKISGSIEMKSTEGFGTTFTIKIPLTLAIVSALIIGIGEERFAIPQLDVRELVMISPQSAGKIETVNGTPLYRLRDRLLPLVDLRKLLNMNVAPVQDDDPRYIIAIHVGAHNFGLIVDKVFDTEEIVVKPVTSLLRHLPVFSGNTILGDGQVIMILDPSGIMNMSGTSSAARHATEEEETIANRTQELETQLLLFETEVATRAVPLRHVARLEEIDLASVEWAGGRPVVQYCGTLMPVYQCEPGNIPTTGKRPVIVFSVQGGLAGLVVNRIFDITGYRGALSLNDNARIAASVIVEGHATDIINLDYSDFSHASRPETTPQNEDSFMPPAIVVNSHGMNGYLTPEQEAPFS